MDDRFCWLKYLTTHQIHLAVLPSLSNRRLVVHSWKQAVSMPLEVEHYSDPVAHDSRIYLV